MSEMHKEEWLTEKEILKATGISHFQFGRYRKAGLFTKSKRPFHGRGAGSGPYRYPPEIVGVIGWLRDHRKETPSNGARFWGLWFAGLIDIVEWAEDRLALLQEKATALGHEGQENLKRAVTEIAKTPAKRTDPLRPVFGHLQEQRGRKLLLECTAAIGIGAEPASSFYDPSSRLKSAFEKASGAGNAPDPELDIERMSLHRLREIITHATTAELQQVRLDCETLDNLVHIAQSIDWYRVGTGINSSQGAGGVSSVAPFERLSTLWRSFDVRASLIPFLIYVRRLPEHSSNLDKVFLDRRLELEALVHRYPKASNISQ
jgi:hypothetical protein